MSLLHAVGGGATEDKLYVEDVFSTYLYTGNSSTQTINNGIDLAGKGGLVWIKNRKNATWNALFDTARGVNKYLTTNDTAASATYAAFNQTFTSNGFALNTNEQMVNASATGDIYASWTFRKAPKFFDVVTYTGNGVAGRQIPHNLGCEVGMMIVKRTNVTGNWRVWHRGYNSGNGFGMLNTTIAFEADTGAFWGNNSSYIAPTSTNFTVSSQSDVNANGATYIAYLFAHDPSAAGIIQCGSFTTDGSGNATVNLGWEPQWLMIKRTDATGDWITIDNMRGCAVGGVDAVLFPNLSNAESVANDYIDFTPTGFISKNLTGTYIYTVIRRPMKIPTSGTEVFKPVAYTGTNVDNRLVDTGILTDMVWARDRTVTSAGVYFYAADRLRGNYFLAMVSDTSEALDADSFMTPTAGYGNAFSAMNGFGCGNDGARCLNYLGDKIAYAFKRAKGFMDNFCWTGTGINRTINHNLGAVPDLLIFKSRSGSADWQVWFNGLTASEKLVLNSTAAKVTDSTLLNNTLPTSTLISLGTQAGVNNSSATYVGYAFANLPGIQAIGTYTGNGTTQTINCGFTTGARFVLAKRTDSTGDWYVWDTARGIVAANDPHLSLNATVAEVTTDDSIDPASSGFIVNQVAATNINVNGGSYIFLAIA